ncbi:Sorting nexin-17 [Eumeta japonica]|uniref:Sorting nexin-17 n=1 Tax=Eumeta variegata TaxID=151549 RepID=A0A4C1TAA1_EUMVA|nr:Sorting nexin-17 [Eumeta japonica]
MVLTYLNATTETATSHQYSMRAWYITCRTGPLFYSQLDRQTNHQIGLLDENNKNYELSFEYLVSKDNLKWITLRTEHATFISVCLQSIVDELMRQKQALSGGECEVRSGSVRGNITYLRRDGSTHLVTPSSSSDTLSSTNGESGASSNSREIFSVQRLTEKFASVMFKPGKDCVENNAYEGIGDEDL